jgi:hypothetical protein
MWGAGKNVKLIEQLQMGAHTVYAGKGRRNYGIVSIACDTTRETRSLSR